MSEYVPNYIEGAHQYIADIVDTAISQNKKLKEEINQKLECKKLKKQW